MANKTIHELSSIANLSSSDELAIYDVSGSVTGNGTIEGILGTDITGLDTTATNLIDAINQHEDTLSQKDLLYADDEEEPTGEVDFTSQDTSLSPTESVSVDLLSGNDSWSQRFVKISQMFKNIRYLLSKIGSSTMGTTATTLTGAIAEHESDISTLNSNFKQIESGTATVTRNAGGNTVEITFSNSFTTAPMIFVSYQTGEPTRFIPYFYSRSRTGAVVGLYNTGAAIATSVSIGWIAVEL